MKVKQDVVVAVLYVTLRFLFTQQIFSLSSWAINLMEITFAAWTLIYYRKSLRDYISLSKHLFSICFLAFLFGALVANGLVVWELPFPFDLRSDKMIFLIMVIAPLVEEILFRFLLWMPFKNRGKLRLGWLFTSILFSYGHLHAAWFSSIHLEAFFIYQAIYALVLGVSCGAMMYFTRSLVGSILIHLFFNFGFLAKMLFF